MPQYQQTTLEIVRLMLTETAMQEEAEWSVGEQVYPVASCELRWQELSMLKIHG